MGKPFCLMAIVCLGLLLTGQVLAGELVQTLMLKESFGISHPKQVVDFDLAKPVDAKNCYLIGPDGSEVPCQIIDGGKKLALQTDLPAGAVLEWKLMTGKTPAPVKDGVKVAKTDKYYEITNELIGIRIPVAQEPGQQTPAPIQGIRYRDGRWTAKGPNYLSRPAKSMTVSFLEKGPVKVVMQVAYAADQPAGAYYRSTIEVRTGDPCILFMEEAENFQVSYDLDVNEGLEPDRIRFRHHEGGPYHGPGGEDEASVNQSRTLRVAVWDVWIKDGGWQLQALKASAPPTANLLGLFPGPAAPALAAKLSRVCMITQDNKLRVHMQIEHYRDSNRLMTHNRFCWGMFLGLRSDATQNRANANEIQEVERQRNRHSGIDLNKFHRLVFDFPEPAGKFGSLYMKREALDKLINRLRTDENYYAFVRRADGYFRPVLDMWRDKTGRLVHEAATRVEQRARESLRLLLESHGIMHKSTQYYEGVFFFMNYFYTADQVLASEFATDEDRAKVKKAIVLWASIYTDDNHSPMQEDTGLGYGTDNQPLTYLLFRDMFITYLSGTPQYKERAREVVKRTESLLKIQINEYGSHMGCIHYVQASAAPMLSNMQQLKQAGIYDFFKNDDRYGNRLTKFSEFVMNALTPREPRFGNVRKMISTGHGSTESSDRYGVLATGFADVNKELSMRLMGAWRQNGSNHQSLHGSTILKIDDTLPDKDPALGSADFPGHYSVLREGWGTPNETAVWLICGDWYRDHKHNGDTGEVIIYALGAPLSIDFGSMYEPDSVGAQYHSVVVPAARQTSSSEAFQKLPGGAYARAMIDPTNAKWRRAVSLAMLRDDLPVIAIQDSFAGTKTAQLNCMSEGNGETTSRDGVTCLAMKGQTWKAHTTQGIDWDIYLVAPTSPKIGFWEWGHNWHPTPEKNEFKQANGTTFREQQKQLRVSGDGVIRMIIVPYSKGKKPAVALKQVGDDIAVSAAGKAVTFKMDGSFSR